MSQVYIGSSSGGGGGGNITTITGNVGGHESPVAGNFNFLTANSTVLFAGSSATETLDFGIANLLLGSSGPSITTATNNSCYGYNSGNAFIGAQQNSLFGPFCGALITNSFGNCGFGYGSLGAFTNGPGNSGANSAFGQGALGNLQTGVENIGIGVDAGASYTTNESSNICIGHAGVALESNTIRIGTPGSSIGQQDRAFLAGIAGVTVSDSAPVGIDSNGQLSSLGFGTAGQIFASNGPSASPTFQTAVSPSASNALVTLATTIPNVTGDGTFYGPIDFDTVMFDVDSNYNTSTGYFTAPITGKYLCCCSITLEGLLVSHTNGEFRLEIAGSTYTRSAFNPYIMSSGGLFTYTFSLVVPVSATQTIGFAALVSGGTKVVGIQGNNFGNYSFASFTLLG